MIEQGASFECVTESGSEIEETDGEVRVGLDQSRKVVKIGSIDLTARSAMLSSGGFDLEVSLLVTEAGVTFVERSPSGNLGFFTIFAAPGGADPLALAFARSTHLHVEGTFASQSIGACVPVP